MRIAASVIVLAACAAAQDYRAGTAMVDVTPPPGTAISGYYYKRAARGVHDPLHAKAIVIQSGEVKAALVACDMLNINERVVAAARALIERDTGIPAAHVMISATHAHTGPDLKNAPEYEAQLPAKIAESVRLANAALAPVRIRTGSGAEPSLAFNRRFFMKDGSVGWNPGKANPNIVRPAGPIDPEVAVVGFDRPDAAPLAIYVNYAMHLDTVGGEEFSADYPYTLAKLLGAVKGPEMLTMFTTGACGNVNHIDTGTRTPQKGHGEAARIGTVLAAEVLKTSGRLAEIAPGPLRVHREIVKLPLAPIRKEDLPWARDTWAKFGKPNAAPFLDLVRALKTIEVAAREGRPLDAEVQVITAGRELAIVALPGEVFVELGLAIKQGSPYRTTIVVELANASLGYIPNRKAYAESNYEPVSARCAAGSGEMLVETALDLLRRSSRE